MSSRKEIAIPILLSEGASLPYYASDLAAGADICARLSEQITIQPGESALIPSGIKVAIPEGYEIQVRPRSGLALKYGITVLNTPGTIDSDFRGEIGVILINHGRQPFIVLDRMRIAQLVVAPVVRAHFVVEMALSTTSRNEGGFGHTGV